MKKIIVKYVKKHVQYVSNFVIQEWRSYSEISLSKMYCLLHLLFIWLHFFVTFGISSQLEGLLEIMNLEGCEGKQL